MDALVPALIAALAAGLNDRPAWLAAILADRFRSPLAVLFGLALAFAGASAIAAVSTLLILPILTPNARQLMLALTLLFAGVGCLMRGKPPERLEGWRLGALLTAGLGGFVLALGDRTAFLVFGFAAWGASPAAAAIGGTIGATMLAILAASMGEAAWRRLPIRLFGAAAGVVFLALGALAAAGALRLV